MTAGGCTGEMGDLLLVGYLASCGNFKGCKGGPTAWAPRAAILCYPTSMLHAACMPASW